MTARIQPTIRHHHETEVIKFDFPLSGTIVNRSGDNLSFTPPGGETHVLANFFNVQPGQELPCLVFSDSEELNVTELHALLAIEQNTGDFETRYIPAEGPATASSSGVGEYSEDAGELIAGVERIGMLDPDSFSLLGSEFDFPDHFAYTDSSVSVDKDNSTDHTRTPDGENDLHFTENAMQLDPILKSTDPGQADNQITDDKIPAGSTFELPSGSEVGEYGILTLNEDGTWTYNLTADINYMAEGQDYTESFPVIVHLPDGSTMQWQVNVIITGDNDAPNIEFTYADTDDAAMTRTAGEIGASGQMTATDPEGNSVTFTDGTPQVWLVITNPDGSETRTLCAVDDYGVFQMDDYGHWTFTPAPEGDPNHQRQIDNLLALAPGQRVEVIVKVTATDSLGMDSDPTDLTITVTGTDQGPQFDLGTLNDDTGENVIMNSRSHSFTGDQIAAPDPENETVEFGSDNSIPDPAYTPGDPIVIQGLYGSLTLQPNGDWTYTLRSGLSIDFMTSGVEYQEVFKINAVDEHGNVTEGDFVLTITGDNDNPVITGARYGEHNFADAATPDATTEVLSGEVFGADIDMGDGIKNFARSGVLTAEVIEGDPAARSAASRAAGDPVGSVNPGDYGRLIFNPDGTWQFIAETDAQRANLRALGDNVLVLKFNVVAYDNFGGVSQATELEIYVNGNNTFDPVIDTGNTATTENQLTEDGKFTGQITGTDASDGDSLSYSLVGLVGDEHSSHGAFVINPDGSWVYTPTHDINMLAPGEVHTHTYTIRITDGHGGETTKDLVLTFTGSNDDPVVVDASATINDQGLAGNVGLSGAIAASDIDEGSKLTFSEDTVKRTAELNGETVNLDEYGTFTLNPDGTWSLVTTTPEQKDKVMSLGQGDSLIIKIDVIANDGQAPDGAADGKDDGILTITIIGTNQAPVFVGATLSDQVFEHTIMGDGSYTGQQLEATDVDNNDDTLTYSIKGDTGSGVDGLYGTFTMTADGVWTFTLFDGERGDIRFLPAGVSYEETFTALVTDEHGATSEKTVTLTITGDNDAPVMEDASATATDMDMYSGLGLSGQIAGTDPDLGDSVKRYNFGTPQASINDVPVADISAYGVLTLNPDGTWSFTAVTDAQKAMMRSLGEDENLVISVPVSGTDSYGDTGNDSHLTITVTGTNQAPEYLSSTVNETPNEDTLTDNGQITGKFEATDPDNDDISYSIKPGNDESTYGRFHVNPDGTWDYTPTGDVNSLAEGESITEKVTVTITDENGGTTDVVYELTITGTNDAPTLTSVTAKNSDTDLESGLKMQGNITATDPEGDAITYNYGDPALNLSNGDTPLNLADYGTLTLNPDGSWSFEALDQSQKDNLLGLGRGESLTITVPVSATDSHGDASNPGSITITITGTNQAPDFGFESDLDAVLVASTEDEFMARGNAGGEYTGNLTGKATDIDGDSISYTLSAPDGSPSSVVQGLYGTLSLDADGTWHYQPKAGLNLNFMSPDDTYEDTFTIVASDGQGGVMEQPFTVTITGDNDNPVITGSSYGKTDLEAADGVVLTGTITATDIDAGDSIKSFAQDDTQTITGIIRGQDGSVIKTLTLAEIQTYGEIVINPDGSWRFVAAGGAENLRELAIGESLLLNVPVSATDSYGGTGHGSINIEIRGTNSLPLFDSTSLYVRTNEDEIIDNGLSGQLKLTTDDGDDPTYFSLSGNSQGKYGALTLNADGNWTYTPTVDINFMAPGQSYTETFTVIVSDGRGGTDSKTLTINISGDNDKPTLIGATLDAEDSTLITGTAISGQVTGKDVDEGDSVTHSAGTVTATLPDGTPVNGNEYGFFRVLPDGNWTFAATTQAQKDKLLSLAEGEELTITAQVVVTDKSGATGSANVVITITGSNDGPILQNATASGTDESLAYDLASTTEPVPYGPGLSGDITGYDPEDGAAFTFNEGAASATIGGRSVIASDYGTLFIDPATGHWTFKVTTPEQQAKMLSLREGEVLEIRVPVHGTDNQGLSGQDASLTITITGSNQGPIVNDSSLTATTHEDTLSTAGDTGISGRISATDPDGGTLAYDTTPIAGKYGTLTLTPDGKWTYVWNQNVDIDFMHMGDNYQETFTITVSDGQGGTTQKEFTLNITGDNDAPHIINTSQGTLADLPDTLPATPTPALEGNVLAHDHDEGDTITNYTFRDGSATLGGVPVNIGDYGTLSIDPATGAWTLTPTTQDQLDRLNGLGSDQALVITVTVDVTDSSGGTSSKTFPITVNGSNTAPGILPDGLDIHTTEDVLLHEDLQLSGTVQVRNDDGDTLSYNISSPRGGTYGMLTLDHDTGLWTYTPYTDLDKLYNGQTYTDTFTIQVSDGRGGVDTQELTVTITGDNDAPKLTAVTESYTDLELYGDGATSLSGDLACTGTMAWTDVDTGDSVTFSRGTTTGTKDGADVSSDTYGYFTLDANGNWTFEAETAAQKRAVLALKEGEQLVLTMNVIGTDKSGATDSKPVTIVITGTNQAPVLEDLSVTSTDTAISADNAVLDSNTYGKIPGYDPEDGASFTFTEGSATATIGGIPADLAEYGVLTVNDDGTWSFRATDAAQQAKLLSLGQGENLVITLPVHGTDATGASGKDATLTITINGSNQGPVLDPTNTSFNVTTQEDYLVKDAEHNLTGTLQVSDPDGDTVSYTPINEIPGKYGTFSLDANGNWTYTVKPGLDINFMNHRENYTETFTVTVSDGHGGTIDQQFTLTIVGSNDIPVIESISITSPFDSSVAVDTPAISGQVTASDPDEDGTIVSYAIEDSVMATLNGTPVDINTYGKLSIDENGVWSLTPTTEVQRQALESMGDDQLVITATMLVTDNNGGVGNKILTLTLNGTNRPPVFDVSSLTDGTAGLEDAVISTGLSGQFTADGVMDAGDSMSFSVVGNGQGTYGRITVNPDGTWNYHPTTDINFMKEGQDYTETFTIRVSDGQGGTVDQVVTLTITGENDAPVLQSVTQSVDDAALASGGAASGTFTGTDAEGDQIHYSASDLTATLDDGTVVKAGDYGTLTVNDDGSWSFKPTTQQQMDNLLALGPDQKLTVTATVSGSDGMDSGDTSLTITINGTNQAPTVDSAAASSTDTAMSGGGALSGSLIGHDAEGDDLTYNFNLDAITAVIRSSSGDQTIHLGDYGNMVVNPDGSWTLQAVTQAQKDMMRSLGQGESLVVIVPVSDQDSNGAKSTDPDTALTITITGSSQGPDFDATTLLATTHEDTLMTAGNTGISGDLAASDPDGDTFSYVPDATGQTGLYGTFTVDENGHWTYKLKPGLDIDFMAPGQNYQETFTVAVIDSTGQVTERQFTVDIAGDNDNPEIVDVSQGALNLQTDIADQTTPALAGTILATDPDEGDSVGNFRVSGPVTATVDGVPVNLDDYGKLTVNPDGSWTFTPTTQEQLDNLNDLQNSGKSLDLTATVVGQDNNGGSVSEDITITVGGPANLPPAFDTTTLAKSGLEDDVNSNGLAGDLKITAGSTEAGETLTYSLAPDATGAYGQGQYGSLTLGPDGHWVYTPTRDLNFMAEGQTYDEVFRVRVSDGKGGMVEQDLVVTITGQNDTPVIGDATADLSDLGLYNGLEFGGTISLTDVDESNVSTPAFLTPTGITGSLNGAPGTAADYSNYGTLQLDPATGKWTFAATTQAQKDALLALNEGDTLTITVPLEATDGTGNDSGSLTITISGTNQAPVFTGSSLIKDVTESTLPNNGSTSGQLAATDPDTGNILTYELAGDPLTGTADPSGTITGQYGTLTLNRDGSWTYTRGSDLASLPAGEDAQEQFTVMVSDGHGGVTEDTLIITIKGDDSPNLTNSAPTVTNATANSTDTAMDAGTALGGTIQTTDANGDTVIITEGEPTAMIGDRVVKASDYGDLVVNDNGTWTFTATTPEQKANMIGLGQGENLVITVPLTGSDGKETGNGSLTITVAGSNQAPTIVAEDPAPVAENDLQRDGSISGQLSATDPDNSDSLTYTAKPADGSEEGPGDGSVQGKYGDLTVTDDGKWTYVPSDAANKLAAGESAEESFIVVVSDGHGGSSEKEITISITGSNDAPILQDMTTVAAMETDLGSGAQLSGVISGMDPDLGDNLTYSTRAVTATLGGVSVDPNLYGTLSIDPATGAWTFKATTPEQQAMINSLNPGQSLQVTATIRGTDQGDADGSNKLFDEGQLVITIGGEDQPAVINDSSATTTDQDMYDGVELGGNMTGGDPDGELSFSAGDLTAVIMVGGVAQPGSINVADYGTLFMDANGKWAFRAQTQEQRDNMLALKDGESLVITVPVSGGEGGLGGSGSGPDASLTITVTGLDQPPVVEGSSATATDAAMQSGTTLSGSIMGHDPEGEAVSFSADQAGTSITLTGADGTPATITFTFDASGVLTCDYGVLTLDSATGKWTFRAETPAQKANLLALGEGEELVINVPVLGSDGSAPDGVGNLVVTVTGSSQGPDFDASTLIYETHEDNLVTAGGEATGTLAASDPDGDTLKYVADEQEGLYGTLTLDDAGNWTYQIKPGLDINFMAPDGTYTETFTVQVEDSTGQITEREFTIDIAGDNDVPVISGASEGELNLDAPGGLVLDGQILATDPDVGDTPGNYRLNGSVKGTIDGNEVDLGDYGELIVDPDGSWHFMATTPEQQANLRQLGDKELILTAEVASTDDHGGTGYGEITVSINGNDAPPVITQTGLTQNTHENALMDAPFTGTLNATGELGETLTFSLAEDNQGNYGSLQLNADGSWTYTPTMDLNFMSGWRTTPYTETFRVRVSDGKGGVDEQVLTINITGDNDAPVIGDYALAPSDMELVSGMEFSGTITPTIIDAGDQVTLNPASVGAVRSTPGTDGSLTEVDVSANNYGDFQLDPATGEWTFAATTPEQKARLLALAEGETLTISVDLTATDQAGASGGGTLTITITGSNQAPVFTGSTLTAFTDEAALTADPTLDGKLSATDPDSGDVLTYELVGDPLTGATDTSGTVDGLYGKLTLNSDGTWTYTRDENLASLEAGQNYSESFVVRVKDKYGAVTEETLTINIGGDAGTTNNAPVLADSTATVTDEDMFGGTGAAGTMSGTDADGNTIHYSADQSKITAMIGDSEVNPADYGTLVMNDDGTWTFKASTPQQQANMESLPEGESLVIHVPVSGTDNTDTSDAFLTITVAGTNQDPVLDPITPPTTDEDSTITGQFTATDPDTGDELTYTVKPGDGSESGSGDGSVHGKYGVITVTDDGQWTYIPTDDADKLAAGEKGEDTFIVVVSDGHGGTHEQEITITLTGTNDAPVLDNLTVESTDAALGYGRSISGSMTGFDAEGDSITYDADEANITITGGAPGLTLADYGVLTMNPDGTWTFQAQTAAQRENMLKLGPSDTLTITVPVSGSDGKDSAARNGSLTIVVAGSDQGPNTVAVITNPDGIRTHEDAMMAPDFALRGSLAVSDPDGDNYTYSLIRPDGTEMPSSADGEPPYDQATPPADGTAVDGLYGTLTLNADGTWTYTRYTNADGESMDLNFMAAGHDYTDTFKVYAQDDNGVWSEREISFIISGDNDAPTLLGVSQPGLELLDPNPDGSIAVADLSGRIIGFDPDEGDTLTNFHIVAGSTLVLEISGKRLDLSNLGDLLNGLLDGADPLLNAVGSTLDGVLNLLDAALKLTGVEALVLINPDDGTFTLGSVPLGIVLNLVESLTDGLRDLLDTLAGLDSNLVDVLLEALPWLGLEGKEDLLGLRIMVEAEDQHGTSTGPKEIGINLVGGNTGPEISSAAPVINQTEDQLLDAHFISGTLSATDNENDPLTYSVADGGHGTYGSLTVNPDGTWTYTLTQGDKLNGLNAGEPAFDSFTVRVDDGHGGYDEQLVTINITGANDAPILKVETLSATLVDEDVPASGAWSGKIDATDADSGAELVYTVTGATANANGSYTITGKYGTFTMDKDGNWQYTPDDRFTGLTLGQTDTEVIQITVSDGQGGTQQRDLTLTVVGTDNDPVWGAFQDNTGAAWGDVIEGHLASRTGTVEGTEDYSFSLNGSTATFPQTMIGQYGTLVLEADGSYVYTPFPNLGFMAGGADGHSDLSYNDSFNLIITDSEGNRTEDSLSFGPDSTVILNDAPVISGTVQDDTVNPSAAELVDLAGRIQVYDPDEGDTLTFTENGASSLTIAGTALTENGLTVFLTETFDELLGGVYNLQLNLNLLGIIPLASVNIGDLLKGVLQGLIADTVGGLVGTLIDPLNKLVATGLITIDPDSGKWTILADQLEPVLGLVDDLVGGLTQAVINLTAGLLDAVGDGLLNTLIGTNGLLSGLTDLVAQLLMGGNNVFDQVIAAINQAQESILDVPLLGYERDSGALGLQVPVLVEDGKGGSDSENVMIDILGGANHPPVFVNNADGIANTADDALRSIGEDALQAQHSVTGTLHATDSDVQEDGSKDSLNYVIATHEGNWGGHGKYGSLTLNEATGDWEYSLTKDISALAEGETYTEVFEVVVRDGRGGQDVQEIRIEITGSNDAPVFNVDSLDRTVAESQLVDGLYSGQLEARDADSPQDSLIFSLTSGGLNAGYTVTEGADFTRITEADGSVFTLYADGRWTYKPNVDPDPALGGGLAEVLSRKFGVTVTDDHGASSSMDMNLNMVGTNQAPTITTQVEVKDIMTSEDAMMVPGFAINGKLIAHDPEGGDISTGFSLQGGSGTPSTLTGMYGTLTLNGDGTWTYERIPGMDLDFMGPDQKYTDSFTITTADGSQSKLNFNISGDNDAPVIVGVDEGIFVLDILPGGEMQNMDGRILAYDPDEGDKVSGFNLIPGSLILEIAGQRIDLSHPEDILDGLLDSADPLLGMVGELVGGLLTSLSQTLTNLGTDGLLKINDDGTFSLVAGPLADILNLLEGLTDAILGLPLVAQLGDSVLDPLLEALPWLDFKRSEDVLTIHVKVEAHDRYGASTGETELSIGVVGGNSSPVFTIAPGSTTPDNDGVTVPVTEGALLAQRFVEGQLGAMDTDDATDTLRYYITGDSTGEPDGNGRYGTLTLDETSGKWVYTLTKGDVVGLNTGESYTETFTVMVSDGHGGQDSQDINIVISGESGTAAARMMATTAPALPAAGEAATEAINGSVEATAVAVTAAQNELTHEETAVATTAQPDDAGQNAQNGQDSQNFADSAAAHGMGLNQLYGFGLEEAITEFDLTVFEDMQPGLESTGLGELAPQSMTSSLEILANELWLNGVDASSMELGVAGMETLGLEPSVGEMAEMAELAAQGNLAGLRGLGGLSAEDGSPAYDEDAASSLAGEAQGSYSVSAFSFAENTSPDQDSELRILQLAMQNG